MPRLLTFAAVLALAAPAFATIPPRAVGAQELREYKAVSTFAKAVDQYVLMRRITEPLPPDMMCLPDGTIAKVNDLAVTPFDARPVPREGDVFSPDVADVFRERIVRAIRQFEVNVWDLVSDMNEEESVAPPVVVGEPLPRGVGEGPVRWLTAVLPVLPEGLEYRLAGRDLVLFDTQAKTVVDVLRVAVPVY
ncbi:MAG TPA: hypothetical protein VGF24_13675 [Vicinamibacterales bacterium]|jgi:hypothetical protein